MWIASEIAAADIAISNVLFMYVGVGALITGGLVCTTIGWSMIKEEILKIALVTSMVQSLYSDWLKGLSFVMCFPMFLMFFIRELCQSNHQSKHPVW